MAQKKSSWISIALFAVVALAVYFGNVEIQTWLGEKALAETGLEMRTLSEAMAKAKAENKLVLADMSAIWCPSCRKLDQEIFSNPDVQNALKEKYVFARIEYESDEGKAFMTEYGIRGFPTLLALDANGAKLREIPATLDPYDFIANL